MITNLMSMAMIKGLGGGTRRPLSAIHAVGESYFSLGFISTSRYEISSSLGIQQLNGLADASEYFCIGTKSFGYRAVCSGL
jgi:hypothetical protein